MANDKQKPHIELLTRGCVYHHRKKKIKLNDTNQPINYTQINWALANIVLQRKSENDNFIWSSVWWELDMKNNDNNCFLLTYFGNSVDVKFI